MNAMKKIPEDPEVPGEPENSSADEFDVDVTAEEVCCEQGAEHLGDYATVDDYFREQLEELVMPSGQWLLACLDMAAVRRRFEGGRYRYFVAGGRVYRAGG